jgi:hypothetical protein
MNCGNVRLALIRVGAIEYRSTVHGSADMASVFIGPDGHQWEMLTVNCARATRQAG